tara:strand:- start:285 stop:2198 length:1914 start_codon:yes stop_codon:yes gene_type:complete
MSAYLNPQPKWQFFDNNGNPLAGGKIYTYAAGTTTPLATYTNYSGSTPNANPIILDSRGEAPVWFSGTGALYYIEVKSSADVLVYTADNVGGSLAALLAASSGSSLVGYLPGGANAVATTVQAKLRQNVSVLDFGANTTPGTTDMTAAFTAALTALSSGGRLYVPPGTYLISSLLTLPSNVLLEGASDVSTVIKQSGAFYAVKMGAICAIRNIKFLGTSSATGAIDVSNIGWGDIEHCHIEQFNGTNAVSFNINESYRVRISHCYIYDFYYAFKFAGSVTTLEVTKCNIGVGNASGRAIDATSGTSIEAYFNTCYFESCYGPNPIYCNTFGHLTFTSCGFEAMCVNPAYAGSIANPKIIQVANPTRLTVDNCQFSGYQSVLQTYTGILYVVYANADSPLLVITRNNFTQNVSVGSTPLYIVNIQGKSTLLTITNNEITGTGFTTVLDAERALLTGINVTYGSRMFTAYGNRCFVSGVGSALHQNSSVLETSPPTGFTSTSNSVITSTGTSYSAWSRVTPKGSWRQGGGFKIVAWGRRIGTAGTKRVLLGITANTLNSFLMTASVTAADNWKSDVVVLFRDYANQSFGITATDGAALFTNCVLGTKDTLTYDTTIEIIFECSNAADSMTLDGMVIQRF